MKIIIVRHGETSYNREEIFRGRIDIPLNKTGEKQAKILAENLRNFKIDKIFSSPLKRAIQTAEEISKIQNIKMDVEESLIDMDFGRWQGLSLKEVKKRFPQEYKIWEETPQKIKIPQGESLKDVRKRLRKFLEERVFNLEEDFTVCIVSHRVINKILILTLLGLSNRYFWYIKQDVAKFTVFEKTRFGWVMDKHNLGGYQQEFKDF